MKVGILALQGSFVEHENVLKKLEISYELVRTKEQLKNITHLIIPGGESTTMRKLLQSFDMWNDLVQRVRDGTLSVFGTCAGAILCQDFGFPIEVIRNGYGPQQESQKVSLQSKTFPQLEGVFIRAPKFKNPGKNVEILAELDGEPVLLQYKNMLIASFHPELTKDVRVHQYFLK